MLDSVLPRIESSSTLMLATAASTGPDCGVVAAESLVIGDGSRDRAPVAVMLAEVVAPGEASGSAE